MNNILKITLLSLMLSFISCKKDTKTAPSALVPTSTTTPTSSTLGKLNVEFENVVDTIGLQFGTNYVNQNADTFKVSVLQYYISNIVVTNTDNTTFVEPNSYHLIDHSTPLSSIVSLINVPMGSYKSISFMLGVDSTRNVSGAQAGDLNQANGMYWPWIGYIMFKIEGTSLKVPASNNYAYAYHIGGYGGALKAQRNFTFNFVATPANVSTSITPKIHLQTNVLEVFKTPNIIDLGVTYDITSVNNRSKAIADNYADMIRFKHVHN